MRRRFDKLGAAWPRWRVQVIDTFVLANLAFLTVDIYIAHSINAFAEPAEWAPLGVSVIGSALMLTAVGLRGAGRTRTADGLGYVVGYVCVGVGVAGMLLHLDSRFFVERTLTALVYSAPFVAPLAYAGLGMLLIMNRMVSGDDVEWGRWVVFLACAGFVGNFGLSLADHAQNGFFHGTEWVPVITAAFAVGFLTVACASTPHRRFLAICVMVMLIESGVGIIGFALHVLADLNDKPTTIWQDVVFGAPVFAPLLFPNLALLAIVGLLDLRSRVDTSDTPADYSGEVIADSGPPAA
ncbi:MAG: hypothetical protein GC159_15535 [Phycisphaera sp.]|nr:hypothetical protein [Phycisphaera sp.]